MLPKAPLLVGTRCQGSAAKSPLLSPRCQGPAAQGPAAKTPLLQQPHCQAIPRCCSPTAQYPAVAAPLPNAPLPRPHYCSPAAQDPAAKTLLPKALLPSPHCCSPAAQGPAAQPADKAPLNCFTSPTACRCAAVPPSPTASCCAAVPLPSLAAHRCADAPLHMCNTAPLHCLTSPTASRCCRSAAAPLYLSAWTWLPCCTELITARSHGQQQQQQQQQQSSHYISFSILLLQWATQMHGVNDARRHRPETDGRGVATFSRHACVWPTRQ